MSETYCIIDANNLVQRIRHSSGTPQTSNIFDPFGEFGQETIDGVAADMLDSVIGHIYTTFNTFHSTHLVVAFDSKSWRKVIYPEYKKRPPVEKTPDEIVMDQRAKEILQKLEAFLRDDTCATVLRADGLEADDLIAVWVKEVCPPNSQHVIMSTDGDFRQLVNDQVHLYDPLNHRITMVHGAYNKFPAKTRKFPPHAFDMFGAKWENHLDKNGEHVIYDIPYELVLKCIRGDKSDNIPSAWPRVRETKIRKAYDGDVLEWNNFIMTTLGEGDDVRLVKDQYDFNRSLIDFDEIPDEILEMARTTIFNSVTRTKPRMVMPRVGKFCNVEHLEVSGNMTPRLSAMLSKEFK